MACNDCPVDACLKKVDPKRFAKTVSGRGPKDAKLAIVTDVPSSHDTMMKVPLTGRSGQMLKALLTKFGVRFEDVYVTSAIKCVADKDNLGAAREACSESLFQELDSIRPQKILSLGAVALTALRRSEKMLSITNHRGLGSWLHTSEDWSAYYVPTYSPAYVLRDDDFYRDFASDVGKWLSEDAPYLPPQFELDCASSTVDGAEKIRSLMEHASMLSVDIETTGFSPTEDKILAVGVGARYQDGTGYSLVITRHDVYGGAIWDALWDLLTNFKGPLVFHNGKFDLQFFDVYFGRKTRPQQFRDTMLMKYAQDERPGGGSAESGGKSYRSLGLKDIARVRWDIPDYHFDFNTFYKTPEEERDWDSFYRYLGQDCYLTLKLFEELNAELQDESKALPVMVNSILHPAAIAFKEIELGGVLIDRDYLRDLGNTLQRGLDETLGFLRSYAAPILGHEDFNPNSAPQVKKILYGHMKLTGKNGESTERDELIGMARKLSGSDKDFVLGVADYRQRSRELGTYVNGLLSRADSNGYVHPDFLLQGTSTGRLSCRDPNLQNIPTLLGKEIRDAFIVPVGCSMIEADQSQLELRVAAHYSQDERLMNAFEHNEDVHRLVASMMFKKPQDQITKYERYLAKYVDFGVLYGRGARSLATGWEMEHVKDLGGEAWSIPEAEKFLNEFLDGFPGLKRYISTQHEIVKSRGFIETPMGRRRRFPFRTDENISGIQRQAVNTPIQSFASDLVLGALTRLHYSLPEGARILFTVHDSIAFEVRDDLVPEVLAMIHYEMEENLPVKLSVPLKSEAKVGLRWGSLEDV